MNKIQIFNFNSSDVNVQVDEYGVPWFKAKDVCDILGLTNTSKTLEKVPAKNKKTINVTITPSYSDNSGHTNVLFLNEAGLYRVIFRSDKPSALKFQEWVFEEVLPEIRTTGSYSISQEKFNKSVQSALGVVAHKTAFYDDVVASKDLIPLGDAAKILYEKFNLGRTNLSKILKHAGVFTNKAVPLQKYIDGGWFEVKFTHEGYRSIFVTGKGMTRLHERLPGYIEDFEMDDGEDDDRDFFSPQLVF